MMFSKSNLLVFGLFLILASIVVFTVGLLTTYELPVNYISQHALYSGDGITDFGFEGSGSELDPYKIQSSEHLIYLAKIVNEGNTELNNSQCHYVLCNDIYLNDISDWENWNDSSLLNVYTPIGWGAYPFNANFDGNNFAIHGVFINSSEDYQGVFGYVYGSLIKDLTISEAFINGSSEVGGIAGRAVESTFINCHVNADINAILYAGGISGYTERSSFLNCSTNGTVASSFSTGGISGFMSNCETIGCFNYAEISGDMAGGIVGMTETATVLNCFNVGMIFSDSLCGGIAGYAEGGTYDNLFFMEGTSEYALGGDASISFEVFDTNFVLSQGTKLVDRLNDWVDENRIGMHFEFLDGIIVLKKTSHNINFTVFFNVDINMTILTMLVIHGETIPVAPTFDYEIAGFKTDSEWYYLNETGEHKFIFGDNGTPVASDIMLYIKWELIAPTVNNQTNSLEETYNPTVTYELTIDYIAVEGISYITKWYKADNSGNFTISIGEVDAIYVKNVLESGAYKAIVAAYARGQVVSSECYHNIAILPAEQEELLFVMSADIIVFDPTNTIYHMNTEVIGGSVDGVIVYELVTYGTGTGVFENDYLTIITVGTFFFTAKLNGNENYNLAETKEKFVLTVEHASVERPTEISGLYYTGASLAGVKCGFIDINYLLISGNIREVNASKYSATFSLFANYKWADGENELGVHTVDWEIAPRIVTTPNFTFPESYIYSGTPITGVADISSTSQYTVSGNTAINAGTYTTIISLNSKTNYVWSNDSTDDFNIKWTIKPFTLSDTNAAVSIVGSEFKHTGIEIKPKVDIVANSLILLETEDYTLSYFNNLDATDTAEIVVSGTGNFCGSIILYFVISKADIYVDVKLKSQKLIYTGDAYEDIITVSAIFNEYPVEGILTIVNWDSSSEGEKTFNWLFSPCNSNFNETIGEITVTIIKATLETLEILVGPMQKIYNAFAKLNMTGIVLNAIFINGKATVITSGFSVVYQNGGKGFFAGETAVVLSYSLDDITVTATLHGLIVNKIEVATPDVNNMLTYNGEVQSVKVTDNTIYTVSGETEKIYPGSYNATLTLKDSTNYRWKDSENENLTLNWQIAKATQPKLDIVRDSFKYSFEEKIQLQITGGMNNECVKIKQLSGFDVAKVTDDGVFTILNVGSFAVELTVLGNENYEDYTTVKYIIITKGENPQDLPNVVKVAYTEGLILDNIPLDNNWYWVDSGIKLDVNLNGVAYAVTLPSTDLYVEKTGFTTVIVSKGEGSATIKIDNYREGTAPNLILDSITNNINNVIVEFKIYGTADNSYSTIVPVESGYYTVSVIFNETEKYLSVIKTADFIVYPAQLFWDLQDTLSVIIEPSKGTEIQPNIILEVKEVDNFSELVIENNFTVLTAYDIYLILNGKRFQPSGMLKITLNLKQIKIKTNYAVFIKSGEFWEELSFKKNGDCITVNFETSSLDLLAVCIKKNTISESIIILKYVLYSATATSALSFTLIIVFRRKKG